MLCKSKSEITVEYALEIVNKPIGVATYIYTQQPEHIAKNLPYEEQFNRIIGG